MGWLQHAVSTSLTVSSGQVFRGRLFELKAAVSKIKEFVGDGDFGDLVVTFQEKVTRNANSFEFDLILKKDGQVKYFEFKVGTSWSEPDTYKRLTSSLSRAKACGADALEYLVDTPAGMPPSRFIDEDEIMGLPEPIRGALWKEGTGVLLSITGNIIPNY